MESVYAGLILIPWRHHVLPEHAQAWCQILNDPNPIHLDSRVVAKLGMGDRPVNQGPANISYLYNMLAGNFPQCRVIDLKARMTAIIYVGDLVEVTGEIRSVAKDGDAIRASCVLQLHAFPHGPTAVDAVADVLLPVSAYELASVDSTPISSRV